MMDHTNMKTIQLKCKYLLLFNYCCNNVKIFNISSKIVVLSLEIFNQRYSLITHATYKGGRSLF